MKDEGRGQRTEDRGQRTEDRGQRLEVRGQERVRRLDHFAEHLADLPVEGRNLVVLVECDVTTISGKIQ